MIVEKPKILITGGSGMVGRNLLESDLPNEWTVLAPSSRELNLMVFSDVENYLQKHKPSLVIHAAGLVGGIQANLARPVDFLDQNTIIGRNIVMAAYQTNVKNLLNLGSTCMYPSSAPNPLQEDAILTAPLEPTNEGYGLAKIVTMRLCQFIMRQDRSFNYKTLIPCNLYGRHDNFEPEQSHLLAAIIAKIHNAKVNDIKNVEIWGDGSVRREFMYVGDLAEIIFQLSRDLSQMTDSMNCGTGKDYTVKEYYQIVSDVIGWRGQFKFNLEKPTGMKQKLCSVEQLEHWGWEAPTKLHEGIASTYDYFLNSTQSSWQQASKS